MLSSRILRPLTHLPSLTTSLIRYSHHITYPIYHFHTSTSRYAPELMTDASTSTSFPTSSSTSTSTSQSHEQLTITDNAVKRLHQLTSKYGPTSRLRLSIDAGGCSGYSYHFAMETGDIPMEEDDVVFTRNGVSVVVDSTSLALLRGSTLDYTEDLMKQVFVVTENPQSTQGCGCGVSFNKKT